MGAFAEGVEGERRVGYCDLGRLWLIPCVYSIFIPLHYKVIFIIASGIESCDWLFRCARISHLLTGSGGI